MMRALFSGVTGLRSHQTRMDVIGNNIANVNTMGYKKMTTTFKDLYNETISSAASTSGVGATATGGVNAKQIGLGAAVGAISAIHTPGSAQYTGHGMDVAISGDGYFAVLTPTGIKYTRAGEFATDLTGNFVTKEGYYVLTVDPRTSAVESLKVPENGVHVNTLLNQLQGIRGAAHTGNITADLSEVQGSSFSIEFEEGDEAWSTRYVGDTTDTYYPNSPLSVVSENGLSSLNVKEISNYLKTLAANPDEEMKIGTNEITFAYDDEGKPADGTMTVDLTTASPALAVGDVLNFNLSDGVNNYTMTARADSEDAGALIWTLGNVPADYTATFENGLLTLTAKENGLKNSIVATATVTRNVEDALTTGQPTVDGAANTATINVTLPAGTRRDGEALTVTLEGGQTVSFTYDATNGWTPGTIPAGYTATFNGTAIQLGVDPATTITPAPVITSLVDDTEPSYAATFDRIENITVTDNDWFVGQEAGINMMYGDKVIGKTDTNSATANTRTTLSFVSSDGSVAFGDIVIEPTETLGAEGIVDSVLNKMNSKPMITLEENGQWVIKRDGVTVEKIVMEYSDNVNGGILGDVQFNTSSYGSILLDVQADGNGNIMPNQQALSEALSGNSFTIDVETEFLPSYTVPAIITADSLKTLTIDFDRYTNVSIDTTGAVLGQLKNDEQWEIDGKTVNMDAGDKVVLAYISMATFNNPSGLEKVGDNMFEVSANSGNPVYGTPGNGSAGSLAPSNLEMSNVDLSEEMVNMIITQRGFQANSRIITTTDTMLEELVNLKR